MRRSFGFLKNLRERWNNLSLNKELVGEDMYGNKYYQHFDDMNLPSKREVIYKEGLYNPIMDPIWNDWLKGKDREPPSKEETSNSYQAYLSRKKIGDDWDAHDEEVMSKFREAFKKANPPKQKEFKPETWKPKKPK